MRFEHLIEINSPKVAVQTVVGVPVTGIAKSLFGGGGSTSGGGASDGTGLLSLGDFEPEFARWGMLTDVLEEGGGDGTRPT